jgi:hypothetical protein
MTQETDKVGWSRQECGGSRRRVVIRAEEAPVVGGQAGGVKAERHHRIIVRGKRCEVNHQLGHGGKLTNFYIHFRQRESIRLDIMIRLYYPIYKCIG